MPYNLRNEDLFCASLYGTFHRMEHVNELVRALQAINYGVVDSRRSGLEALESFENKGFTGDTLFGEDTRFPGGIRDTYMTQFMGEFGTVVISLQSSLSWRLDANPKDVKNVSKSGQEESNYTEKNGEKQDNTKRFEELLKRLARMRSDVNELWRQRTFEYRVSAVWTEPAAQAAGQ